ncbi:hypothetical protein B0I31_101674 [Saccharothrix carnea]|uniref:Lipoprotein LpqN n=1 Tax=Saccharothrix carnea TaxID=1280637 RepID=A0A2P8IJ22_SACCR|nr:hypothetical protein [Saccharothrix carnea]PSL58456.1 hypothetical protein B0I31_101674 [Saccharothrix carnea]
MNPKNPIGALPLALTFTAVYLTVAGTAGYLTLTARQPTPTPTLAAAPSLPAIPSTTTTTTAPPTTTTTNPTPDQRQIQAPGGLTTTIPADWTVTTGTVATTLVATDPASPEREVRLGGAPVTDPAKTLLDRITEAATDREREPGHRRVTLAATTIRDHPAVTWEFTENTPTGPKQVATAFWEVAGVEYVLYSAGPPAEWDLTRTRLTLMVDAAKP